MDTAYARILLVYNNAAEFSVERLAIWSEVIPELQSVVFQRGGDLEFSDALVVEGSAEGGSLCNALVQSVLTAAKQPRTLILCLLGDVYGNCDLPLYLRKEEHESMRSTLFEHHQDIQLLDEYYVVDQNVEPERFRLSPSTPSNLRPRLLQLLQAGAKNAYDEGLINQVNPDRQKDFFISPLHILTSALLALPSEKVLFLLRKFECALGPWGETDGAKAAAIANLKNTVSAAVGERSIAMTLPSDAASFFSSKEGDKYKHELCKQLVPPLKERLALWTSPPLPPVSFQPINAAENSTHIAYAMQKCAQPWIFNKKVDAKLDNIVTQTTGTFVVQGPPECGKTATLCHLWEMIGKRKPNAIRVIRFISLTYSSLLAHEIWHSLCLSILSEAGVSSSRLLPLLEMADLLSAFSSEVEALSRPVYIFIDDLHLMRLGRLLSVQEKRSRKVPSNLVIIATALNISSLPQIYPVQSTTNLDALRESDIIDILKKNVPKGRRMSSEDWGIVKQQVSGGGLSLGRAIMDEILTEGQSLLHGGLSGRLARIECRLGLLPVQLLCTYITVSFRGITRTELADLLCSNRPLLEALGNPPAFPPLLMDDILEALGGLLISVVIDGHTLLRWSSSTVSALIRSRYITASNDNRMAHTQMVEMFSDCLGDVVSLSPRPALVHPLFPQALKRDNGTVNIRKIRNLWFNLLHTGNMDALKEVALCNFDYLDGTMRSCGISHLLSMYEECLLQVLHHDIQVLAEQVLLPALETIVREPDQMAAELIGRLRFTRAENSHFLNTMVEQAMAWVDVYTPNCLLVPLSCWISPPKMSLLLTFSFKDWKKPRLLLTPTFNHQHILVTGNAASAGDIYMVHIASQFLFATFSGHTDTVTSICESNEGDFFVSTSTDKTIRVWNKSSEAATKVFRPHSAKILCSALSSDDDFLVTGAADSCAKVIDLATGDVRRIFREHTGSVVSIQLTSDNHFLITGSGDFVVQIWDLQNGRLVNRLGGLMAPVTCIALTSNDAFCAVACEDETLRVFGTVSSQELHDLSGHEGKVNALVAARDDCQLFAATLSRIYCYDVHTGQIVLIWNTEVACAVSSLQITRDNFFLISGCGSSVHVWNIRERNLDGVDSSLEAEGHVTSIALSPDEKIAACGTFAGIIALWDLDIAQCVCTVMQRKRVCVTALAFSLDSSLVLSGNAAGSICLLESSHGRVLRILELHCVQVKAIACLDSTRAVSLDKAGNLRIWELLEEEEESELKAEGLLAPLFVPASGKLIISHVVGNPKELRIWGVEPASLLLRSKLAHNETITSFSAAPSGNHVVTASADCSLKIWQMESGYLTQVLAGHDAAVTCCAMSDDCGLVVSGSSDGRLIMWDVSTGASLFSLRSGSSITTVAMTADASVAFSGDEHGWLEAWSCDTGQLLSSFNAHRPITAVIRSFDANRLILRVSGSAQLPILCLHNTPAGNAMRSERRRSARNHSISSLTSNVSDKRDAAAVPASTSPSNGAAPPLSKSTAPRSTFDKLERSKSRVSVIEKDKTTQLTLAPAPLAKSRFCSLL